MTDRHARNQRLYRRRAQVLEHARELARELARSGEHADHTTIIPLLERMEDFNVARLRLEEPAVLEQLDRLCAMARGSGETN